MGARRKAKTKRKFTQEEDALLTSLVEKYGEDWDNVSSHMPTRNARQVRDRYVNYLSPDVRMEPFTLEEDELIVEKINEIGPRWILMKKYFKGRSDIALKNRWLIVERKIRLGIPLGEKSKVKKERKSEGKVENAPTNNECEYHPSIIKPEEMFIFWNEFFNDYKLSKLGSISFADYSSSIK